MKGERGTESNHTAYMTSSSDALEATLRSMVYVYCSMFYFHRVHWARGGWDEEIERERSADRRVEESIDARAR